MFNKKPEYGFNRSFEADYENGLSNKEKSSLLSVMEEMNVRNKLKYQSLFEHINTGFAYLNTEFDVKHEAVDFVILECNSAFKSINGITNKNIIGEKFSRLFSLTENWCQTIFHNLKKVSMTKKPMHFELYIKKLHRHISFSFYYPCEGYIEFLSRDVTELKDTIELKRISTYFTSRFINVPSGKIDDEINNALFDLGQYFDVECCCIFLHNGENNTFIRTNKWVAKNSGIVDKYYPAHFDAFSWLLNKITNNNMVKLSSLNELPEEAVVERAYLEYLGCISMIILPIFKEDKVIGILQLFTCNYEKVWPAEQVELLKTIGTIFASVLSRKKMDDTIRSEIDKLVKLKENLKDSEEMYKKLTFSIQDAIIMLDSDGRVVNWNKAAQKIFGYTFQEVADKKLHDLIVPPEMVQRAEENFVKFKETGKGRFIDRVTEVHAIRKDGTRFVAEVSISSTRLKGITHTVGIIRDITERRQTQKKLLDAMDAAEAANKAKSQFLANISHEIRTPMNGIIGFLDLLSKTSLDHKQKDYVREIKTATDALMDLINDLLDFSKIEANKLELEHISFNPRKIVEEATSMFSLKAYSKGTEINAIIDNAVPLMIKGDPGKLKQVVVNLISNAVKFTHEGQVTITVRPVSQTTERVELLFSVSDTGIGISEADRKKLFEPFTQVDASTTRKYGGTGLGLSICERLVEMMSGKITVDSETDKGSTFSFQIGFDKVTGEQEETVIKDASLKGLRILVASPSSTNRELVRNYLEGAGCIISEADKAAGAVEILKNNASGADKIDMILLDNMPDGLGLDIAARIKAEDMIEDTIINLFVPYADSCDKDAVRAKGISELIMKPVYRDELMNEILSSIGETVWIVPEKTEIVNEEVIFSDFQKKNTRILLAEDNITNQKLAASILDNAGLAYDISNNGREAVEAMEKRHYDMILMDCQMPEMDGYEATEHIRQTEAGRSHIIIIAMTANVMKSDINACLESGMDDYIGKPFKADYLLETIAKWLDRNNADVKEAEVLSIQTIPEKIDFIETNGDIPKVLDDLSSDQHIDRVDIYEIYNDYVDLLPEALEKLQTAIDTGNFKEISCQAHTLKGSSATLRLKFMSGIAAEIDKQAKAGNIALCRSNMKSLVQYCKANIRHINM